MSSQVEDSASAIAIEWLSDTLRWRGSSTTGIPSVVRSSLYHIVVPAPAPLRDSA